MISFKNKNIVITGVTSGIGKCLFIDLLKEGANIAYCGRSQEKMNKLNNEIKPLIQGKVYAEVFDMANAESLQNFIKNTFKHYEKIDMLINCAGLNSAKDYLIDIKHSDLDFMMAVNFKAPFTLMQEIGKKMKENCSGTIVNILSSVCLFNNEKMASYTASKVAMNAASKIMNKEMRKHNVRVVSVYPGGVDTDFREIERPDYMPAQEVADVILANLRAAETAVIDDLVFRPLIEQNFQ